MSRVILALVSLFAAYVLAAQADANSGVCLSSPGNGPSIIYSGDTIWAGYSFTYPTVHEESTVNIQGKFTLGLYCSNGATTTVSITIPKATFKILREEEVANPLIYYPTGSESGTAAFQGSTTAPAGCTTGWQVSSSRMCLTVTASNTADAIWLRYHYAATTGSATPAYKWSDVKAISPTGLCSGNIAISNPECGVACECIGFELIFSLTSATGETTLRFAVTNACKTAVSYIAIGTAGLAVVGMGKTFTGINSGQTYSVEITGNKGNPGFPSVKFVSSGDFYKQGYTEIFEIKVNGYYPGYDFALEGHIGGFYEEYQGISFENCHCPQGGCSDPPATNCPPGYKALPDGTCSETECADLAPNGEQWICVATSDIDDPYRLGTKPVGAPMPSGAFDLGTSIDHEYGVVTQYYKLYCDCERRMFSCPNSCCGAGLCDPRSGTCNCTDSTTGPDCCDTTTATSTASPTSGTVATAGGSTSGPTTAGATSGAATTGSTPNEPPCYNGGVFCSGHGFCVNGQCECQPDLDGANYVGVACEIKIVPPTCYDYMGDCDSCLAPADASLSCVWCSSVAGAQCLSATDECLNPQSTCGEGVVPYETSTLPPSPPPLCNAVSDLAKGTSLPNAPRMPTAPRKALALNPLRAITASAKMVSEVLTAAAVAFLLLARLWQSPVVSSRSSSSVE